MNEETIFAQAIQIADPQRRTAFLDQACGEDSNLRAGVAALLKSHEEARSFLEVPALDSSRATILSTEEDRATADESAGSPPDDLRFLSPSESPGVLGTLGQYEVLSEVGRGGLGVVLKARDTRLDRIVAIKVPASEYAAIAAVRQRFTREAKTAAAVSHDHLVTIHAVDEDRGIPYLVMEYVDGISLQDAIDRDGPLELKEILRIGVQTARGLAAAHEQGLVHRDIKPANILLENGIQRVKITDFGLARAVDDVSMTQTGTVAGTPQYMSPEQAHAEQVDHRSDLFSLGSVLYAMCTGRAAFRADSTMAVLKRVCEDTPKPIRQVNSEIPEWLCGIVEKLLAKRPEDRFQSAGEVADLLNRHLAHLQQPESNPMPAPIRLSTERVDERAGRRLNVVRNILAILGGLSLLWFFAGLMMPYHGAVPYGFRMPSLLLSIVVGALALNGARHVARRSSYAWAVGGCIACLLPVNMVWLVALPLGMVALGSLMRREVKAAFGIQPVRESTYDDRTVVTGSSARTTAGESTLVARCRRRYRNSHHRWGDAAIIVALLLVVAIGYVVRVGGVQNAWNNVAVALGIDYPHVSPWEDFRWDGDVAYAKIDGRWYEVVEIESIPPSELIVAADAMYPDPKKRIVEDLVEVLARIGRYGGEEAVTVSLRDIETDVIEGGISIPMTPLKRHELMEAIYGIGQRGGRSLAEGGSWPPMSAAPAPDDDFFVVTRNGELVRIRIEGSSIETTVVRELGAPYSQVEGLALAADGALYAAVNFGPSPAQLHRIDPATGAAELVGTMNHAHVDGLTFDVAGKLLGVVSQFGSGQAGQLIEIDPLSGASRAVGGDLGLNDLDSLTIDANGFLVTTDGIDREDAFYRIDRLGSEPPTRLARTPPVTGDRDIEGLTQASDGFFYAVTNPDHEPASYLLRIDPETFEHFNLGSLGVNALSIVVVPRQSSTSTPSEADGGLYFDGSDDAVYLPLNYDGSHPITLEAWLTIHEYSSPWANVVDDIEWDGIALGIHQNGHAFFGPRYATETMWTLSETPIPRHRRTHLAGVFDGRHVRLFIDGELQSELELGDNFAYRASIYPLMIGANLEPGDHLKEVFNGVIHAVRISDSTRYETDFTPPPTFETDGNTLALYRLDEGTGEVALDSSGNAHDGRIRGAVWSTPEESADDSHSSQQIPELVERALQSADERDNTRLNVVLWEHNGRTALRFANWNLVLEGLPIARGEFVLHGLTDFLSPESVPADGSSNEFWLGSDEELRTTFEQTSDGNTTTVTITAHGRNAESRFRFELSDLATKLIFSDHEYEALEQVQTILVAPDGRTRLAAPSMTRQDSGPVEIARSSRVFTGTLATGDPNVFALAFTHNGDRAVTGHFGGRLVLWDVAQGSPLHSLEGHTRTIHAVAISPDEQWLASGGEDSVIRLWNLSTGQLVKEITGHTGRVMSLAFRDQGRELISTGWDFTDHKDNTIRIWDVETGEERGRITRDVTYPVDLALPPDGSWAAVSDGGSGRVGIWDLGSRSARHFFAGFATTPASVALSSDGALLAAGYNALQQVDGKWDDPDNAVVRIWSVDSGLLVHELRGHSGSVLSVQFSPDDRYILSLGSDQHDETGKFIQSSDHTARVWDVKTGEELVRYQLDRANLARWMPNGRSICTGVRIWDIPEVLLQDRESTPGPATPADQAAGTLFRQFERSIQEADSIALLYDAVMEVELLDDNAELRTVERWTYGGSYEAKPGGKDASSEYINNDFQGHGARSGLQVSGTPLGLDPPPYNFPIGPLTRTGFYLEALSEFVYERFRNPARDDDPDQPLLTGEGQTLMQATHADGFWEYLFVPVENVRLNGDDNAARTRVLQYQLRISDSVQIPVTLTLDADTLTPRSRSISFEIANRRFEFTENYHAFSTDEIPEPFTDNVRCNRLAEVRVVSGELLEKSGDEWLPTEWILSSETYRTEQETRVAVFDRGSVIVFSPGSEMTFEGNDVTLTGGHLSARIVYDANMKLTIGGADVHAAPLSSGRAIVTASPDRIVVEQGALRAYTPNLERSLLLKEGTEYQLVQDSLVEQPQRTLPPALAVEPDEQVVFELNLADPETVQGLLALGTLAEQDGRPVLQSVPRPRSIRDVMIELRAIEDNRFFTLTPQTHLRFRYHLTGSDNPDLYLHNHERDLDYRGGFGSPQEGHWTTFTIPVQLQDFTFDGEAPAPLPGQTYDRIRWEAYGRDAVLLIDRVEIVEIRDDPGLAPIR